MNAAQHTSRFAPTIRTTPHLNRERSVPSALSTFTTARWGQVSVCLPSYRTDRKRTVSFLKPGAPPLSNRFFPSLYRIGGEEQGRVSRIGRREALLNEGSPHLASCARPLLHDRGNTMLEQSYVTTGL